MKHPQEIAGHRHDPGCRQIFEALSEYLDGELSPEECRHLESHMAGCAPCIEFLETLKRSIQLSRRLEVVEPPPAMPENVKARLTEAWQAALSRKAR
jgi:anti-sigma factor RsiW